MLFGRVETIHDVKIKSISRVCVLHTYLTVIVQSRLFANNVVPFIDPQFFFTLFQS